MHSMLDFYCPFPHPSILLGRAIFTLKGIYTRDEVGDRPLFFCHRLSLHSQKALLTEQLLLAIEGNSCMHDLNFPQSERGRNQDSIGPVQSLNLRLHQIRRGMYFLPVCHGPTDLEISLAI